jgi:Tol biopolymer transport system component
MELEHCPNCDAFNPPGASVCQQCNKPLPEIPDKPPQVPREESAAAEDMSAPPATPDETAPPVATEPPPFEAPPAVLTRVESLRKNIEQNPSAKALYMQLSQIYAEGGRRDLGVLVLEQLLEVDPKNVYVRHRIDQLKRPAAPPTPTVATPGQPPPFARPAGPVAMYPRRATPAGPLDSLRDLVRRRKGLVIATSIGLFVLGIAAVRFFMPSTRRLVTGDFRAYAAKWSPTGKHFAFLLERDARTNLAIYDMRRRSYRVVTPIGGWGAAAFDWSPNGRRLAYVASADEDDWRGAVRVLDVESGQFHDVGAGSSPAWCADGTNLLIRCSTDPTEGLIALSEGWTPPAPGLCRMNSVTGETQRLANLTEREFVYSPQLDKIAFDKTTPIGDASSAIGVDPAGEFVDFVDSVAEGGARNLAEGSRDLSREFETRRYMQDKQGGEDDGPASFATDVFVMDASGLEPIQITNDGISSLISWTPDGQRILLSVRGASGPEIWTMNPSGGDRTAVIAAPLKVAIPSSVTLTADGRYALFVSPVPAEQGVAKIMTGEDPADLHIVRVGTSSAKRLGNKHPFKQRFALSPDGKRLVYEIGTDVKLLWGAERSELWLMSR